MKKKSYLSIPTALLLALLIFGVAYATTITVDGNPADWPGGAFLTTDPNDAMEPGGDLSDIYFTNDTTYLYWRFDTYAETNWMELNTVFICMDTDNNQSNGTSDCCGGGFKADYALEISENSFQLKDGTDGSGCDNAASSTGSVATADSTTEVRALLSELGINSNRTIPSQIEAIFADDLVEGLEPVIPGPTVVRVEGFSTRSGASSWAYLAVIPAALVVFSAVWVIRKRK